MAASGWHIIKQKKNNGGTNWASEKTHRPYGLAGPKQINTQKPPLTGKLGEVLFCSAGSGLSILRQGQRCAADAFIHPPEYHKVQHHADDQRNDNIQDAVLLDEHRGGIDKHR